MRDFDWAMVAVMIAICALGVLQIFSATHDTVWQGSWWKQVVYIAAGIVLMWIATSFDYHALMSHVYPLYIASLVLLAVVLAVGKVAFGSTRWIALPAGIHLQVSEFAKIAIILLVARFLTELNKEQLELRDLMKLGAAIVVPMALISCWRSANRLLVSASALRLTAPLVASELRTSDSAVCSLGPNWLT